MTTRRQDIAAVLILTALWLLFFWRLLTPVPGDQASLKQGDFSGQFVAFAAYQHERLRAGEVPLWNPYNNGGLPFIADTQAAVFYPPRLLTIALAPEWTYHALELEMALHVLLYTLLIYLLLRRMTLSRPGSTIAGLIAAIIAGYGGYLSGYPPLQLAILEAGIWLPLAVLGILEATRRDTLRWGWFLLTGLALGLSWLAGHPQTSWFLTYLLAAYTAYRVYVHGHSWRVFVFGTLIWGGIAFGLAAVQLLPGLEYLPRTARVDYTYEAKGNGFPIRDVVQLIYPGIMSLFSPLYVGIIGLVLAIVALWRGAATSLFWGGAALIALGLSFGANSAIFPALYNLLPGLRFFRGQERAVYIFANSVAILAGLGFVQILNWDKERLPNATRNTRGFLVSVFTLTTGGVVLVFSQWLQFSDELADTFSVVLFSSLIAAALVIITWDILDKPPQITALHWALVGLIVFELFSVNMDTEAVYDPIPPTEQLAMTLPPLVSATMQDALPYRVDGYRGLHDNYGSLYGVMDMRGISPLFLDGPFRLIEPDKINPLAWELFAVSYVYSDWQQLPIASEIVASGEDRYGPVNLHRLSDPRPFAHMVHDAAVVDSDAFAQALLNDPNFDARRTVILNQEPGIDLPNTAPDSAQVEVTAFAPESFTIEVSTLTNGILTIAHPDYPGWQVTIDGDPVETIRAYGALTALPVSSGEHTITFHYDPLSYRIGALLSLVTWIGVGILGIALVIRGRQHADS